MKTIHWPLTAILVLALAACSQDSSDKPEAKKDATPAAPAAATTPAPDPDAARIAENARLDAIHSGCLKRLPAADAQTPPLVDGLYRQVPRDKTFSSNWWLSNRQTVLLGEPREGAAKTATLASQTWVEVVEDVAFTSPTRGVVLEPGQGLNLKQCDIVYQIDSEDGEGTRTQWVWHQGRIFTMDSNDGHRDSDSLNAPYIAWAWEQDQTPMPPAAAARLGPWVRLKAPDGKTGWTRNGSTDFDCIWENDRYLNDQPTQCAKFPGAPAKP